MPNWVRNTVKVTERVEEFKNLVLNKDGQFDFNRIIEQPKELSITSGSSSYEDTSKECPCPEGSIGYFNYQVCKNIQLIMENFYNDTISQEEFVNKVVDETENNPYFVWCNIDKNDERDKNVKTKACGYWNLKRFGYIDWYSWAWDNWGTKWNARETYISEGDELFIEFDSAWSTPDKIWEKLAELGFKFTVIYADEDFGSNLGIYVADKEGLKFDGFDNLSLNDKFYLSEVIYYGVDYEDEDEEDEEYKVSEERQNELLESVKGYLM